MLTASCVAAIVYQFMTLASEVADMKKRKNSFLLTKKTALDVIEDTVYLKANYSQFQQLVDDQKLTIGQHTAMVDDQADLTLSGKISSQTGYQHAQRKVAWIKTLQAAKANVNIAEMSFEIFPIQSIAGTLQNLQVGIGFESIVLQVSLLHDGLLAALIAYLEAYAPNPFLVTALTIEKADESIDTNIVALYKAKITIKWYLIEIEGTHDDMAS